MQQEEGSIVEKCPLYILVYICSFVSDVGVVRAVSTKWRSAVEQLGLLNNSLEFNNAECINYYMDPLSVYLPSHSIPLNIIWKRKKN